MPPRHRPSDFLDLLLALESRCETDTLLAAEREQARVDFFGQAAADSRAKHRFREWFLLERVAAGLGVPPVVAWSPDAPEPDSIWDRLLGSFFGIFQGIGKDDHGDSLLEDLWTGRQIRLVDEGMVIDPGGVMVGRVAMGGEDHHVAFPGSMVLDAPGLADALSRDLSAIRAAEPRSRLSQRECENLLAPYLHPPASPETAEGSAPLPEKLHPEEIQQALAAFDSSKQRGEDLAQNFAILEQELGLDSGTSDPYMDATTSPAQSGEAVGVHQTPDIQHWLATFLWEQEQEGNPLTSAARESINAFLEFLQSMHNQILDPDQIKQHQLLAFLCRTPDLEQLQTRILNLETFIQWLAKEQASCVDLNVLSRDLVQQVVRTNQLLARPAMEAESMARVQALEPLVVATEDGDAAVVVGWPEIPETMLQPGDFLRGRWSEGQFQVSAWLPKAMLPTAASAPLQE